MIANNKFIKITGRNRTKLDLSLNHICHKINGTKLT